MIQNAYLCSAQPLKLVQTSVPNCKFVCTLWLCFYCFFQFSAKYEGQYFQARTTDARWGHRLHGTAKIPLPLIDVLTIYLCQKTYDPIWSIKVPLKSVIREDTLCLSYDWDDKKNTIFFSFLIRVSRSAAFAASNKTSQPFIILMVQSSHPLSSASLLPSKLNPRR